MSKAPTKPTKAKEIEKLEVQLEVADGEIKRLHGLLDAAMKDYKTANEGLLAAHREVETLKARLGEATSKHTSVEAELAKLDALKKAIKPFVMSAIGEGTTTPADWDALKELKY